MLQDSVSFCSGKPLEPGRQARSLGEEVVSASSDSNNGSSFVYIPVLFDDVKIAALADTGSSINVMSKTLYDSLPYKFKIDFQHFPSDIRLANNTTVRVIGIATVQITVTHGQHDIEVYVLPDTSHPLILGTVYLHTSSILVDFSNFTYTFKAVNVRTHQKISVPPNTEMVIWGHVPDHIIHGLQGVCSNSEFVLNRGLMIAKCLVTVNSDNKVPLKIMNPSSRTVFIPKDRVVCEFSPLNSEYNYLPMQDNAPIVQNMQVVHNNDVNTYSSNEFSSTSDDFSKEQIDMVKKRFTLSDHLNDEQTSSLAKLLYKNEDLFVTEENPALGYTNLVEHRIHLKPDAVGKHQKPYRLPPYKRDVLRFHLDDLLKQGVIAPVSESENLPITSPIVLVTKRTNSSDKNSPQNFRFCCDFRYLNSQTEDFKYTIPDLQELTEAFSEVTPNYITSIDLSSGFFQMGISPESSKYTGFNTCFGTYKFLRLPMGLKTSPNSFQLLMDKVLHGLKFKSCLCYLDDVLICSQTFEQHIDDLSDVFRRFRDAGLKLGPKKCSFGAQSCIFLGHLISKDGILPPPDRVQAIADYPVPKNVKELRRLVGLFNWFRKFIKNFSAIISPLTRLLKKNIAFKWGHEQNIAFQDLKKHLVNSDMLSFPRYEWQFRLSVDTSSRGIGYMLYQHDPDDKTFKPKIIRFGSKSLSKWQQSYGPTKLELLGMVVSILDCSDYLRGNQFVLECDHQALQPLFQKQFKGAIYERWMAILQQFSFEIKYKPAEQMQVADALSRCENEKADIVESPTEDDPYFPYVRDKVSQITLPDGQNFADLIFRDQVNNVQVDNLFLPLKGQFHPIAPKKVNLHTEIVYDGDTEDIDITIVSPKPHKRRYSQKSNVVNLRQSFSDVKGKLSNKQPFLNIEHEKSGETENRANPVTDDQSTMSNDRDTDIFNRTTDVASDRGVTTDIFDQTTDVNTDNVSKDLFNQTTEIDSNQDDMTDRRVERLELFSKSDFSAESLHDLQRTDVEFGKLVLYLESGNLPNSQKESRKILLQSSDYVIIDGLLFKCRVAKSNRTKKLDNYQLVLPEIAVKTVLSMYHDSPLGGHGGIQHTIDLIKEKYFFPKLAQKVSDYIKSCHACQSRKMTKINTTAGIVAYRTPASPFQVWQIDIYGPISQVSPKGNKYICTAIDLFSKFVFAESIPTADTITVSEVLFKMVTQFGVCDTLISDQGSEFISKCFKEVCRLLDIKKEYTPSFAHHCLGACERSHRTLAERLTPYVSDGKNWEQLLPCIIFSMNNTVNSSLGYSPYEIIYGKRPSFPLSGHCQPSNLNSLPQDCHAYVKQLADRLNLIREEVKEHSLLSQLKMVERVNGSKTPLQYSPGDYVYLSKEPSGPGQKFQFKYAGPYIIKKIQSPHMIILKDLNTEKCLPRAVHINRLKPAYVRQPNPVPYFVDSVENNVHSETEHPLLTDSSQDTTQHSVGDQSDDRAVITSESSNTPVDLPPLRKSTRMQKKPSRFIDDNFINPGCDSQSVSTDSGRYYKVKRILAMKMSADGVANYLVHFVGEPSQNSRWVDGSELDPKTRRAVKTRPPPLLT